MGMIRELLLCRAPEACLEKEQGRSTHPGPPLRSPCPQSSPQQLPTLSLAPGLGPTPAITSISSHYTHPLIPNLALRPALIPIPKMLTLLTACVKGSNR